MDYPLRVGDRVRLTPQAVGFYGGAWPHFVPQAQGGGAPGTLLFAGERPHKPGAAPRPYYVRWDNGAENSYRVEDLEADPAAQPSPLAAPAEPEAPGGPDEPETPANVVPFRRPQ